MEYKKFKDLISIMRERYKKSHSAYQLGINLIEYEEIENKINKILITEILTIEGLDWFEWYLYEKGGITGKTKSDMKAWDKDKKEICYDTKSLYNFLWSNKYFKNQNVAS